MSDERNNNYTIMEGYELPSGGVIYDTKVNKHVELRAMTARDEMKRLSPSSTPLKTLADIIESCLLEKLGIHVYDLCLGDYEYLLHKLRIITYGPNYRVTINCPECGEFIETDANLDELELKEFDQNAFEELRTFQLPSSKKLVVLRPTTPRILDTIEARIKELNRKYKGAGFDFETLVKLEEAIESIDGEALSIPDLETTINNLPAMDMAKILNNLTKIDQSIGLDNILYLSCPKCGAEFKNFFRFGPEFFRPTTI